MTFMILSLLVHEFSVLLGAEQVWGILDATRSRQHNDNSKLLTLVAL